MLQGMKMVTSLENTKSSRSDADVFFTYTNHSHQGGACFIWSDDFFTEEILAKYFSNFGSVWFLFFRYGFLATNCLWGKWQASLNFPLRRKLKHLRMLQGMKMIASLKIPEVAAQTQMVFSLTQITHTRVGRVVSKVMNFLVEDCHRDSPFIFCVSSEWLWVMIDASWTVSMWLAHCCPIRRGVFFVFRRE